MNKIKKFYTSYWMTPSIYSNVLKDQKSSLIFNVIKWNSSFLFDWENNQEFKVDIKYEKRTYKVNIYNRKDLNKSLISDEFTTKDSTIEFLKTSLNKLWFISKDTSSSNILNISSSQLNTNNDDFDTKDRKVEDFLALTTNKHEYYSKTLYQITKLVETPTSCKEFIDVVLSKDFLWNVPTTKPTFATQIHFLELFNRISIWELYFLSENLPDLSISRTLSNLFRLKCYIRWENTSEIENLFKEVFEYSSLIYSPSDNKFRLTWFSWSLSQRPKNDFVPALAKQYNLYYGTNIWNIK